VQHAQARTLTVGVAYGRDAFTLTVADDGIGLPAEGAGPVEDTERLAEPGHFGLRGLQERARQMGGTLDITTAPGQGTQLRLRVRASGAYASTGGWRGRWRKVRHAAAAPGGDPA
jgi:signal transduction histidine kinase